MELAQLLDGGGLDEGEKLSQCGTDLVVIEREIRKLSEFARDALVRVFVFEKGAAELVFVKFEAVQGLAGQQRDRHIRQVAADEPHLLQQTQIRKNFVGKLLDVGIVT